MNNEYNIMLLFFVGFWCSFASWVHNDLDNLLFAVCGIYTFLSFVCSIFGAIKEYFEG